MIETVEAAIMLLLLLLQLLLLVVVAVVVAMTTMTKQLFCSQRMSRSPSHACVWSTTPARVASSPRRQGRNAEAGRVHDRLVEAALGEMMNAADVKKMLVPLLQCPSCFPP